MKIQSASPSALLAFLVAILAAPTLSSQQPSRTGPPTADSTTNNNGSITDRSKRDQVGGGTEQDDILASIANADQQNETGIAINPLDPNNWVGVANDKSTGTFETGWYTTKDGGETWTTGTFGLPPGFLFSGDPVVAFTPNGDVHVITMMYDGPGGRQVTSISSRDGGLTWEQARIISLHINNDKPQVDTDRSNGPYRGDITVAWDRFSFWTGIGDDYVATSKDSGVSWSTPTRINDNTSRDCIAPDVAYGPDSKLYVMWADVGQETIWLDTSPDGGATWGTDQLVTTFQTVPNPIPGSSFRIADAFAMACDWSDGPYSGNLYITYHEWEQPGDHSDVHCIVSSDQGQSWQKYLVNDDGGTSDQFFPGIDTDPQGNVNLVFYDRRLDPNNFEIWTWLGRSSDGGQTWANYQVSDVGWDHSVTEQAIFIGDYNDVESSANAVVPLWCDGRSGSQDVYADSLTLDLFTDVNALSATTGGQVQFTINVGPNHGGADYALLGSAAGTSPGVSFPNGVHLALNRDGFTYATRTNANTPAFQKFQGVLDATGSASATMDTLGPLPPSTIGFQLDFALLVLGNSWPVYASNPTGVSILP